MKVVLSTGHGRLHFIETVEALVSVGVDLEVITGWIPPSWLPSPVLDRVGILVQRRQLSKNVGVRSRFRVASRCFCLSWQEIRYYLHLRFARLLSLDHSTIRSNAWSSFGCASKRYLNGEIFHVRSGAGQGGAISRARQLGMKIVVDHSIAHPASLERSLRWVYEKYGQDFPYAENDPFWRKVLTDINQADVVLVNSDYVRETLLDAGFDANKVELAYLGVRSDFSNLKDVYRTEGKFKILFTGTFGFRKGATVLLDAVRRLLNDGIDVEVHIAGESSEGRKLVGLEHDDRLSQAFVFHGFLPQDELKSLLRHSDLYVFPSFAEGSAKSVMEAMAAGLPVVCSHESGSPIINGETGFILRSNSAEELYETLSMLVDDSGLRESIGRAASAQISSKFQWVDYAERLKEVYNSVL